MADLNIRGFDDELLRELKVEAAEGGVTLKEHVQDLVRTARVKKLTKTHVAEAKKAFSKEAMTPKNPEKFAEANPQLSPFMEHQMEMARIQDSKPRPNHDPRCTCWTCKPPKEKP